MKIDKVRSACQAIAKMRHMEYDITTGSDKYNNHLSSSLFFLGKNNIIFIISPFFILSLNRYGPYFELKLSASLFFEKDTSVANNKYVSNNIIINKILLTQILLFIKPKFLLYQISFI